VNPVRNEFSNIHAAALNEIESPHDSQPFAPVWHTSVVLILLSFVVASSTGLHQLHRADHVNHRIFSYIAIATAEWLISAFIWLGCSRPGFTLRTLTGPMSSNWRPVLRDIGVALAFLIAANILLAIVGHLIRATPNQSLRNLLPHGRAEVAGYLFLALTAAICEEVIYRGYLQRQFTQWTKSASIGIILQSMIFGASHAYQGAGLMLTICLYGCLFGLLARWRGSLRPGMMAHFLQDGIGGLLLASYAVK